MELDSAVLRLSILVRAGGPCVALSFCLQSVQVTLSHAPRCSGLRHAIDVLRPQNKHAVALILNRPASFCSVIRCLKVSEKHQQMTHAK